MKKYIVLLAAGVLAAGIVAGCSPSTDNAGAGSGTDSSAGTMDPKASEPAASVSTETSEATPSTSEAAPTESTAPMTSEAAPTTSGN